MTCHEVQGRMSAMLDSEASSAERTVIMQHLASCRACRAELQQLETVDETLRAVPLSAPPLTTTTTFGRG